MSHSNKPIILVDGSSYLYRAYHALPALSNSKGLPTGAIYGMINMLKRLISEYQPDYMAIIFDAKGKTFRNEIYAEYKATRSEMPSELIQQIEPLHHIIRAMGLPLIMMEGVEADDVIGALAKKATAASFSTLISTGDKDLAQLVNDRVTLINTMTNTHLDIQGVKEKFGVFPEQMIDYLTLVGDSSDNIPGVPQVGPKTAVKWLQQYQTLDTILLNADNISGKVGENLRAFTAQIPLTKSLITIQSDLKELIDLSELKIKSADKKMLITLFKEMEFKSWLSELLAEEKIAPKKENHHQTITTQAEFKNFLIPLTKSTCFAFNVTTTTENNMKESVVGIAFAINEDQTFYIPLKQDDIPTQKPLTIEFVLTQLGPTLANQDIIKIGQDLKSIFKLVANHGLTIQGKLFDTMLESYVLDSTSNQHDLPSLALKYLGTRLSDDAQAKVNTILALHKMLWSRILENPGIKHVFSEIEMPLVPVLARMEQHGVLIDPIKLATQGKELQIRLGELEQEAFQLSHTEFNLSSPKQLQEVLFQKMNLPILQKTPKGQASTADNVLQELALDFEIARVLIEHRSLSKLISTYTNPLITQINPETKRIHTSYHQTGTATGRLSSKEPNLQNIPIRTQEGRKIRQAFIAPKGYKIISADYSQIELRLMAHISKDPNLVSAFEQNLDIHTATAAEVWGIPLEKITPSLRRNAKAINFGLIYGMSAFGLTRQLGIDRKSAQEYIDLYFARYPNVKAYMDNTRHHAKEKGYVETLWGRRLYLPDINASNLQRQKAAERAAINAPLQGSAADIIKLAMIKIDRLLREKKMPATMIMQVHDELVFEVKENELNEIAQFIRDQMRYVVSLTVPLMVSIGSGDNWDQASEHSL